MRIVKLDDTSKKNILNDLLSLPHCGNDMQNSLSALLHFRLESDHLDVHRKSVGSSHEEVHFLPAATKDLLEYRFSIDNPVLESSEVPF